MAHGDVRTGKWRGNWRMEWVASTLHTSSEHGASSITTADAHTSAASSRLNWRPRRFKWGRPFRRKTKSGFCGCVITFETQSTICSNSLRALWQYGSPLSRGPEKFFSPGTELAFGGPVLCYLLPTFLVLCIWLAGLSTSRRLRYTAFRTAHTFHYCSVTEACAHGMPTTLSTKETRPEKGALLTHTLPSYISHFGFPATRRICRSFIQPQLLPCW
jgi:hypothetical protein